MPQNSSTMESRTSIVFNRTLAAWEKTTRYVSSCGGTRSGKTFSDLQLLIHYASHDKTPTITSVVSETLPHLKRGAIRDFQTILGDAFDDSAWNKTDCVYRFPNGSIIEFFSADSPAKVHGPARHRLFLNEAQNISYEVARQLFVRTTDKILIDYNPTHQFWVMDKIESQDTCITIHSTYKDNRDSTTNKSFLSDNQIAEIESNKSDANWWRVYGEGEVGQLDGLIYDFKQIDELPDNPSLIDIRGLDFGFTNDPTSLVHILADTGRKVLYIDEEIYRTRMLNSDIITEMHLQGVPIKGAPIYADCAEPKSIAEISLAGFNILPCDKDAPVRSDKLRFQIQFMQGWTLMVTKRSINLIRELRNYTWAKDKDDHPLNQPIDKFNHALDALRYAVYTHLAQRAGYGSYNISVR